MSTKNRAFKEEILFGIPVPSKEEKEVWDDFNQGRDPNAMPSPEEWAIHGKNLERARLRNREKSSQVASRQSHFRRSSLTECAEII